MGGEDRVGQDLDDFFASQAEAVDVSSLDVYEEVLDGSEYIDGTDFVLSGHSAGAFWGFCADSLSGVSVMYPCKGEVDTQTGNFVYTEQLYYDEEAAVTTQTGRKVTGKLQTLMDMIHSGNDVARTDEAIQVFLEEGEYTLDEMLAYFREHGLTESEIEFALEGLETSIS